jgi:hypothetical protein
MFVVCGEWCQVEVSATGWSLVQRSPTDCGASLCVIKKPLERGDHSPRWAAVPEKIIIYNYWSIIILIVVKLLCHLSTRYSLSAFSPNSANLEKPAPEILLLLLCHIQRKRLDSLGQYSMRRCKLSYVNRTADLFIQNQQFLLLSLKSSKPLL